MSLGKNIKPIKPHTSKALFNPSDRSKRHCLLACQKSSKTRSLEIFSEQEYYKKDGQKIWKHFTRNRGITKLTVKIRGDSIQPKEFKDFERLILLYQNLKSLYVDYPNSLFSANTRLARPWIKSRMLKELHYKNHKDIITNNDLVYLFGCASHMPQLSEISFSCRITKTRLEEQGEERLEMLPVFPSRLTSIGIHIDGLSEFWKNHINTWLLKNKNLKTANLTLLHTNQEEIDNALKSVSHCDSISLFVTDFISLNGLNSLLRKAPGVFDRIHKLTLKNHDNLDVSTFSLTVPYLRNLVHFEMSAHNKGHQDVTERIIKAFSHSPPKSLKTLIITMKNGWLTPSIGTGLEKILRQTNLEELRFYDFLNTKFPLFQTVINSCLDRPAHLRKLRLSYINLLTDRIKEITTQNLYLDSVKELDLLFDVKGPKNVNLANQELKNLVNMFCCFKNLEDLSFNFYYPLPNSVFLDLIPLFNVFPLRKFEATFHYGILDFNQLALESLVLDVIRTKTLKEMTIIIYLEEEQLDGIASINLDQFKRFDSLIKRHQRLSISVNGDIKAHFYQSGRSHFADLTKHHQF